MNTKRRRKEDRSSQGITLVEVCVLVAVIAILLLLALPGGGGDLESAQRNSATQNAKGLGNVFSAYAADHDGYFPDGPTATALFAKLIADKYLPNGDSLFITKTPGKAAKWDGRGAITAANICWDMMGCDDPTSGQPTGVSKEADDNLPLLFCTGNAPGLHFHPPPHTPYELTLGPGNPFKAEGLVVLYKSMGARFVKAVSSTPGKTFGFVSAAYEDTTPYVVRNP